MNLANDLWTDEEFFVLGTDDVVSLICRFVIHARKNGTKRGNQQLGNERNSATTETSKNKRRANLEMSLRPNFFVGVRLQCPDFVRVITAIQNQVIGNAPQLHKCRMDPKKLHLTCFVLTLTGQEQINGAVCCLQDCQIYIQQFQSIFPATNRNVLFNKFGSFKTSVLYADPVADDVVAALAVLTAQIESKFVERGFLSPKQTAADTSGAKVSAPAQAWTPHATILKTSYDRKNGRRLKILSRDYKGCDVLLRSAHLGISAPVVSVSEDVVFVEEKQEAAVQAPSSNETVFDKMVVAEMKISSSTEEIVSTEENKEGGGIRVQLSTVDLLSMQEVQADGYYRSYSFLTLA